MKIKLDEYSGASALAASSWAIWTIRNLIAGLVRRASLISVRKQVSGIEQKILSWRRDNPDYRVRRIRDELRRHEGVEVRAEKVRQTVNAAGLGNPPPQPGRRPVQTHRFEPPLPNAMCPVDILTFQLKRMFRVYLVGIIDDHNRFLVGWGLFRQQTAAAVLVGRQSWARPLGSLFDLLGGKFTSQQRRSITSALTIASERRDFESREMLQYRTQVQGTGADQAISVQRVCVLPTCWKCPKLLKTYSQSK